MPHVIRSVAFLAIGILQLVSAPSVLKADIISDFKQQSGVSEDAGIRRAVYLGRLFNGVTGGPFRRMDSMYAIVTIAQATNVQLYAGDGNTNFDSALAQGKMVDTGIRITNRTQTNTEVIFVPGDPATTPPFKIDVPAGVAINDSLATNNRLDFWVVGDTNTGFTVPSKVADSNANFFIRFDRSTAVPEPASIVLVSAGLGVVVLRIRSKKKK
jgi:hypothetical protein